MSSYNYFDFLSNHIGHNIRCVTYGDPNNPQDICIECEDCNTIVFSKETYIEYLMDYEKGSEKDDVGLRRKIIVKASDKDEESRILNKVYLQLVGNEDYIENRIILNDSSTHNDGTENEVRVYIFNDSKSDPEIKI